MDNGKGFGAGEMTFAFLKAAKERGQDTEVLVTFPNGDSMLTVVKGRR